MEEVVAMVAVNAMVVLQSFKFHRRQNYKRTHGHRQHFTLVEITDINGGAAKKKTAAKPAETEAAE